MNLSSVLGFRKRRIRNRILTLGVIISGMLSIAFAIITFYGQNAGNFVISVDSVAKLRGITISETPTFEQQLSRLLTDPIDQARDVTYTWLKIDEVSQTNGSYHDTDLEYVAYTFYVQNSGSETLDVNYSIKITEKMSGIEDAIRILIIEDGVETMYMKPDEIAPGEDEPYYPELMPSAAPFLSDTIVFRKTFENFKPGQIKKFSLLVWLEGYDPDTNDDILNARIRMEMLFTINEF